MRRVALAVLLLAVLPVASAFGYTGLAPDRIVFFEEVDQAKVLAQMADGDTHLYGNAFDSGLYQDILDLGLPVTLSYGSFNELLLNPAVDENDEPFFQDGRFNAFGLRSVREAMYYLIDRNYIVEEILNGLGVARWTMLDPNFPPYAQAIEACRAIELKYQADDAAAWALIEADMIAAGAELIGGLWHYNGEPVEIIGLIRVEDERLEIGNYFADKLEAQGFTVERIERRSAELAPIWLLSDPTEGQWSYYTGGWISNLIDRDQGGDYDFMYTPRGWAVPLNQGYPMHLFPEADDAFDRLARRDYATIEERVELLAIAENGAADCGWDQWLFSAASPWATASDVSVLVDVAAGISGAYIWAHTARFVDADGAPVVGGTMRMASPSMLTQPWNPVAGSNWLYDAMIQRATEDWFVFPDPFTGLGQPHLVESATVTCVEGTPMGATLDYVTVDFAPVINVPSDAWCDWDAANQQFITVGEKFPDGSTARTKTTITYVDDLFSNLWHDGSQFSFADMLLAYIVGLDFGKPDSPYYDEATVAATEQFLTVHKGLVIESMDPLTVSIYDDRFYLDAEVQVFNRGVLLWPYYSQGMAPWHTIAVGMKAEAAGTTTFSEDKADYLGVDRQNWVAGEQLQLLLEELATAQIESFIPYESVLGAYISFDDPIERYANLVSFAATYDHLWVGNGPMMIEAVDPIAKIVTGVRFDGYRYDMGTFLAFSAPRLAGVEVTGPDVVAIGSEAVFDVAITEGGEAYPAADIAEVKYLAFDATGALAFSGAGVITGDGAATITLTADETASFIAGSSKLEVIAVVKPVAKPGFGAISLLAKGDGGAPAPPAPTCNLRIYDGQAPSTPVPDDKEVSRGAVTVANLNDTDGDGTKDSADGKVSGEKDLLKLVIEKPANIPNVDKMKLSISGDGAKTKLWKKPDKDTEEKRREFPVGETTWPVTVWIEGLQTSGAVKDITVQITHAGKVLDEAKITFIWARKTGFKNKPADALWADAGNPLRNTFNTTYGGKFGKQFAGPPVNVQYAMGMEFTVEPSGAGSLAGVVFDVTRQAKNEDWQTNAAGNLFVKWLPWKAHATSGAKIDESNDDSSQTEESNTPVGNHIYSIDGPGFPNNGAAAQVVLQANFYEFVRVRFDGQVLAGENTDGSRCSDKALWRAFFWVERKPATIGTVTRTGTGRAGFRTEGTPTGFADIVIKITKAGVLGTAEFKLSTDAGATFGAEKTVPADGQIVEQGASIVFTDAVPPSPTFAKDDTYSFSIKPRRYEERAGKTNEVKEGHGTIVENPVP